MHLEHRVNRLIRRIGALLEQRSKDQTPLAAQLFLMLKAVLRDLENGTHSDEVLKCFESTVLDIDDFFGLLDWFATEYCDIDPYCVT